MRLSLLGTMIVCTFLTASSAFGNVWVFGDSLSDTGNFQIIGEVGRQNFFIPDAYRQNRSGFQRISNGPVAVEYLSRYFGQRDLLPSLAGGTNFATFGARIEDPSILPSCENALIPDFGCQVKSFISSYQGSNIAEETVIVSIGANDVFNALASPTPEDDMATAASKFIESIEILRSFGVKKIILLNVPDSANTPFLVSQGPIAQAGATALTDGLNSAISAYANYIPEITLIDLNHINKRILANSRLLGLRNTTDPCFDVDLFNSFFLDIEPVGNDLTPDTFDDNPPANYTESCSAWKAFGYVYWDTVHPTARVQRLSAVSIISILFRRGL